jgi:hypothetical protein
MMCSGQIELRGCRVPGRAQENNIQLSQDKGTVCTVFTRSRLQCSQGMN